MADDTRPTRLRVTSDGVTIETSGARTGLWLRLLAVALVGVAVVVFRPTRERGRDELVKAPNGSNALRNTRAARPPLRPMQARPAAHVALPTAAVHDELPHLPNPDAGTAATPADDTEPTPGGEEVAVAEAPRFGPITPGEKSGVALLPPPGTKPIKRGMLVPEDFELPTGYVRHYQATDDGQRVPAILMFHPDDEPVDEHGIPIPLPPDRVVPPELAPPGLPIQMLELPENRAAQAAAP